MLSCADHLVKLRSGHYMGPRAHNARVDGVTDPTCNLSGEPPKKKTLEHWLESCFTTESRCFSLFGGDSGDLGCLTKYPLRAYLINVFEK